MKTPVLGSRVGTSNERSKHNDYLACAISPTASDEIKPLFSNKTPKIFFMKGISSPHSRKKRAEKFFYAIFNTANAALGTGVLSFPFAYRQSGLILGILITIASASLMGYCLTVILRCARDFKGDSYQQLVLLMYGQGAERCLILNIMFINFMSGTAYLLVISSQVYHFVGDSRSF